MSPRALGTYLIYCGTNSNTSIIMNFRTLTFFGAVATLLGISAVTSCSRSERYAGQWQGNSERILVDGTSDASAIVTLDFAPSIDSKTPGAINISAVIEVETPQSGFSGFDADYMANIAATASICGTYVYEDDDDDDLIVSFDPSTLSVFVDPAGVTFSQNVLTGVQQPVIDSLSRAAADRWRVAITPVVRDLFNRYTTIDDIKVHHTDIMSCEVAHRDYTFRRVGVPD